MSKWGSTFTFLRTQVLVRLSQGYKHFFCRPFLIGSISQKLWGWDFDKDMPWGCSGIQSFSKQIFGNDFSLTQEMKELGNDNSKKASNTTK